MDKQAEERIERRLHQLFSDGMPKTAVDDAGLQTRGSFLRERPSSPFRVLRKRARVEAGGHAGRGEGEETGEREDEKEDGDGKEREEREEVRVRETTGEDGNAETECCNINIRRNAKESADGCSESSEGEVSESEEAGSEDSEEAGSEDSEEAEDDSGEGDTERVEDGGEERRRVFRRLVETNRQYRERLLRG